LKKSPFIILELVALTEWWSGSTITYYVSKEDWELAGKEHHLLLMNHSYEVDWLFGWLYCEKARVLGNCKAYAKKVIAYIPAIGWGWKFAEFVFLERSFEKDRIIIEKQLNEIFDYPSPVYLLLNAEGTRFSKSKHEASVKFAQERGMTVLNHHLIPRTKGFTASLSVLKKKCSSVLDVQLYFDENQAPPTILSILCGRPLHGHLYLRRIPTSEVPDDEEEAAKWLQELFVRKDKLQTSFHKTGDYFKDNDLQKIQPIKMERRIFPLINWISWMFVAMLPILKLLINLLLSGEIMSILIGTFILIICKFN
jgi:lysophosphatidic acid acyltransferase / lysophosphatidylinositol acyltransferase